MSNCHLKEASIEQVNTIGLDIAQHVFQAHGAGIAGDVLFRKRLTRAKLLGFFAAQAPCVVAIEACAGSHYWAREISKLGHTVRLIPPAYVKPFVKRQKNDAADAKAICEAAQRPSMRFVPIKDEEQQANGVVFRARDLLVHQRTQCINETVQNLGGEQSGCAIAPWIPVSPAPPGRAATPQVLDGLCAGDWTPMGPGDRALHLAGRAGDAFQGGASALMVQHKRGPPPRGGFRWPVIPPTTSCSSRCASVL